MNWILALLQALATVAGAVLIYVLGQLLVKLAEPALALRELIGRIAGDLVMYVHRSAPRPLLGMIFSSLVSRRRLAYQKKLVDHSGRSRIS
jgi:hypothetical protein